MRRRVLAAMRLGGLCRCCSAVLPSTAQTWTWASVSPGMRVRPCRSIVSTAPRSGPTRPEGMTSLIRSPSTTTAAPSSGSRLTQSIRKALVKTVTAMAAPLPLGDPGFVHPHLLVGARRPVDPVRHPIEVVLLPEEDPRYLVDDHLLDLRPRLQALLGVHDSDGGGDLVLEWLVSAVGGVGHGALEELLDGVLGIEGGAPAEEEHVTSLAVLDLVEVVPHSLTTTLTLMPRRPSWAAIACEMSLSSG